eukprot:scaffold182595_cov48-Prasinocladus_malaysianus.AAC.1
MSVGMVLSKCSFLALKVPPEPLVATVRGYEPERFAPAQPLPSTLRVLVPYEAYRPHLIPAPYSYKYEEGMP